MIVFLVKFWIFCSILISQETYASASAKSHKKLSLEFTNEATFSTPTTSSKKISHKPLKIVEQKITHYLNTSQTLNFFDNKTQAKEVLEKSINLLLAKNTNKWPGQDRLSVHEQFFWNLCSGLHDESKKREILGLIFSQQIHSWEIFENFCLRFTKGLNCYSQAGVMINILPIYLELPKQSLQTNFLQFCQPHLDNLETCQNKIKAMKNLLQIYLAFPDQHAREDFLDKCRPYTSTSYPYADASTLKFLRIYQNGLEDFLEFSSTHPTFLAVKLLYCYIPRTYLRYVRSAAALKAEEAPQERRIQAIYDTDLSKYLPALWTNDPFLAQVKKTSIFKDTHKFDDLYELDREILWAWAAENAYQEIPSATPRKIFNGDNSLENHYTNAEVEDFISQLDTFSLEPEKISLIHQLLGLEPKPESTTGRFNPYLGHSIYFKPSDYRGDQLLGRAWYFLKKISQGREDESDLKKSLVLGILESLEISSASTNTHCTSRISGEIFKILSWHLPNSKIRSLIAANDTPLEQNRAEIEARIAEASNKAQQIFKAIHECNEGEAKKIWKHHLENDTPPKLWQLYEAYYDDLYRRCKNADGTYRFDENTLIRDLLGNLVNRLGGQNHTVYYQAEFQVLELAFTENMRREFEQQRGFKY